MQDAQRIIDTAHEMADAARQAILPHFRDRNLAADNKRPADFDPVTVADRAAEKAMREVLSRRCPDDSVFGEEYGLSEGRSGLTWILDPIDGTRAFICGATSWGVLIGLKDSDSIRYGMVDQPYIGERFEGGLGISRFTGPSGQKPLAVRQGVELGQATLLTTFPEIGTPDEGEAFGHVANRVRLTRYGLDCYAYALLALGQVDLVIEAGLQPYDIAGPLAVVEAAGGIVTDWQGGSAASGGQVIAAASELLHRQALELLNA
ncbi:inositol monophosphatase family protein [Paracoccus onubensis]|uniref:Inositol monophosphatase family protein n=1 Tax=Paracoccus onubensis TaxID=1675788 RepID=A0A418SZV8_9RHOB|nr:inositol monophosphatase family protein [Paracoccus onubensis]RJE86468.1 inositol monophosphatase family protein [Paracoccus onubensis]